MTKNVKRFFSMLLALSLVFSLVVPAAATETDAHDHAEEAKQEASINMEAVLENITVNAEDMEFEVGLDNYVLLADPDFEPDESDPVIIALETELKNITVLDEGTGESVALTQDQIDTVLYLYTQYMDHWKENADVLGVQTPFFLQYNDNEDALGVLGEMLVLAGVSVDQVRSGEYSFQDLQGTVELFLYAHILGVEYYGSAIEAARDEVLGLIEESGAQTEAQKLLVLNDWMAHINTFDMPYIMNSGKENPPMVAEDPQPHELQDEIYNFIYANYEQNLKTTFETQIRDGLEAEFKKQYYEGAIKNIIYEGALAEMRKNEQIVDAAKQAVGWDAVYEQKLTEEKQNVYDEAYDKYLKENHDHVVDVEFAWVEVKDDAGNITAYTCEEATAKCTVTDCTAELTAAVAFETKTTDATCEVAGKTEYIATATVTNAEGTVLEVGEEGTETKAIEIPALGHDFVEGVCSRCEAVETPAHVHAAVVTITWAEDNTATASVTCGEGCEDTLTVSTPVVTSETTKEATCNAAGETTYTAAVTVKDSAGNAVENVTVHNATKVVATEATGAHVYDMDRTDGACTVCGTVHAPHVDALGDGTCDTCYADMPVEHSHAYTESVTTAATCTAEGLKTFTCECGNSYTEVIPATGHDYDRENPAIVDSTCTEEGTKTYTCKNGCGIPDVETIAVKEHTYVNGTCSCGAVCTHVDADNDYLCDVCGGTYTPSSTSAIPEEITFDAVTLADEGDATETPDAGEGDGTVEDDIADGIVAGEDPEAHEAAMKAVEDSMEDIEAAAETAANEETKLDEVIETIVTGTEEDEEPTECEKQAEAAAEQFMTDNAEAIAADPVAFVDGMLAEQPEVAAQIHAGWDAFWADAQTNGVEVDPVNAPGYKMTVDEIVESQMDTPQKDDMLMKLDENGNPILDEEGNPTYMTPNEAIPVYADMAASQMTPGVINYWEGSQFGALAMGTSVCLGYTKAFTYLVQCMHPEVYLKDGATDIKNADNWKTAQDLYYNENGELDINQNYVVDAVRVTFDAEVTMYGQTEEGFNSDHFWNAVKVDGQWYYVDPCYTDVFTEVMIRDRVETDGQMNHLYFMFSHTSCVELYEGNYSEIKTLYADVATNEQYEDSWMSRIKSNTYFDDGYAYYMYDSTDMLTLMEEYENQNTEADIEDPVYKIVRHELDADDTGDGDTDYKTLVTFNYEESDGSKTALVWDPDAGEMVENEMLDKLYEKHAAYAEIYPSIAINAALYGDKVYFNLANCILAYDIATSTVEMVKEYNTVHAVRDDTKAFGGVAFTTTSSADGADFTVENRPIAGMTIKEDGNMYVSIATNFSFISGKEDIYNPESEGAGYTYEESNYNPDYNSYMDYGDYDDEQLESYGYTKEVNDNDEFMWTANFVDKKDMSHLAGSHSYESVAIEATCGIDAYTENRCTTCGASEPDSRVYEEGTALEHHYVAFHEKFYTKDDAGRWNEGDCFVCTVCGYAVTEPKEPTGQAATDEAMAEYEEALAIYEAAKESAGHTYVATGEVWAEDNSTVTFSTLACSSVCPERKPHLDCLLNDDTITINLESEVVAETVMTTEGVCTEGLTEIYTASGEVEANGETVAYEFSKEVKLDPTDCKYEDGVCTVCGDCPVKRVYGRNRDDTALAIADQLKETLGVEKFDSIILAVGDNERFPDALSGSYLANQKGAPILIYCFGRLSDATQEYIRDNLSEDGTIYILGGPPAVPTEIEELLAKDYNVKRLAGDDRYLTNLAILEEVGVGDKEILVATGTNFPDSLSASATGLPILLVNGGNKKLSAKQTEFFEKLNGNKITILGSEDAVSAELEAAIEAITGTEVARISGERREHTSAMIAERYYPEAEFALIAYSYNFPDGLCGGPLAYAMKAPLLVTKINQESVTGAYIESKEIEAGYVLGSAEVVSDETVRKVFSLAEDAVITQK